ncbi:tetratricopeptide repeat protein [Parahaliea aestuarii]|nr:tetratricopeptide repeat protein [Parahaliea aestuarii]
MSRLFLSACLTAMLGACASAPAPEAPAVPVAEAEPAAPPERAIPAESLYPLLLGEFALRRREYGTALELYTQQASLLRDRGVSAHTTHIAQFMQQERAARESAALWVELEPDNVEANNTYATLLSRVGRTNEALPHLAMVARDQGKANFPILLNRFPELDSEQQRELVDGLEALSAEFPDNPSLLLTRALAYDELQQHQQALDVLARLFDKEPYQYQGLLLEAKLLLEQDRDAPFAHIEEALAANPDDSRLRLQYARLLTRSDIDAARGQFEILSARSPEDGNLLFSLALINHEIGDNLAAKAYLNQLIELGQRSDEAHYYLGRIAEDADDLQAAVEAYMKVSEADSGDFYSAKGRIARILLENGEEDQARALFVNLRQAHPEARERLYALEAEVLSGVGDNDAAMAVLNEALSTLPESSSLRYSRSLLGEKQGNLTLMESDLRAIIAREPDNATALNALGYSLANRTQRYEEARELIERALILEPDEPAILDSMGWVLYRQGNYEDALFYLERAYRAFPDPEVAAHLGEVLWVSGRAEQARAIWGDALLKDPEHEILLSTIQRFDISMLQSAP